MPAKHPKKHSAVPDAEPTTPSPSPASDVSPAELRAQMAILAEQVRRLGDRVGGADDAWAAPAAEPPAAEPVLVESPAPSGSAGAEPAAPPQPPRAPQAASTSASASGDDSPQARAHVVSVPLAYVRLAAAAHPDPRQPDVAAAPAAPEPAAGHDEAPIAERTSRLIASVIAMAERAAEQIRESAEREAASIRAGTAGDLASADRPGPDLAPPQRGAPDLAASQTGLDVLEHQRQALAALAAETDRIEAATEGLRAQARALDAERQRLYEAIGAARRNR
jgi:hypothetical protein